MTRTFDYSRLPTSRSSCGSFSGTSQPMDKPPVVPAVLVARIKEATSLGLVFFSIRISYQESL